MERVGAGQPRGGQVLALGLCTAVLGGLLLAIAAGCGRSPESLGEKLPEVKARFERVCSRCHPLDLPLRRRKSLEGWRRTIAAMRRNGATLTDREAEEIAAYLAQVRGR